MEIHNGAPTPRVEGGGPSGRFPLGLVRLLFPRVRSTHMSKHFVLYRTRSPGKFDESNLHFVFITSTLGLTVRDPGIDI